jgi:uncharacterized alkaline shock family protein YloU
MNQKILAFLEVPWAQYYAAGAAALLFLVEVEYLILKMRKNRKARYITFEQPTGRVSLSVQAIEEFILKISKGFPEITRIVPKVAAFKNEIKITLKISILSGHNVANFAEQFKKNVKSQIQNILGLEKDVKVQVQVVEVNEDKVEVFRDKIFQGLEIQ